MPKTAIKSSRPLGYLQRPATASTTTLSLSGSNKCQRWNSTARKSSQKPKGGSVGIALVAALASGGAAFAYATKRAEEKHVNSKEYSSKDKFKVPKYGSFEDMKNVSLGWETSNDESRLGIQIASSEISFY